MNKLLKTSLLLLTCSCCLSFASTVPHNEKEETEVVLAKDMMAKGDLFVECDNFLNSGKGFTLEFTFDVPKTETKVGFCFMGTPTNWGRLTEYYELTFKANGDVTSNIGNTFKIDGHYYLQIMFADLRSFLNTREGFNGTEQLNAFYIRDNTVNFASVHADLISTNLNAYPIANVRDDDVGGLTFKAYIPKLINNAKYGMLIVPSSYLSKIDDNYKENFKNLDIVDIECEPTKLNSNDPIYKTYGDGYVFKATLININEDNYNLPFMAIPYYEVGGETIYGNFIRKTRTTYYDKCVEFKNSTSFESSKAKVKEDVLNVIYKCEHHIVKTELNNEITPYFVSNAEKVFKTASLPADLISEDVLYAAKNESERGQVIINVPSNFKSNYIAYFEPFINEDDPTAVISQDNVTIEQELYQNVKTNWSVGSQQPKGWYPDGIVEWDLPKGYVPDALLPLDVAIDANENILSGENGCNNALQYTINVPENAKSGTYRSKLVIQVAKKGTLVLPVTLNVFDFKLPEENKNKYVIKVHNQETKALYGTDDLQSVYHTSAFNLLRDRNISGGSVPASYWQNGDKDNFIKKTKELAADPKTASYWLPMSTELASLTVKVQKSFLSTETIKIKDLTLFRVEDKNYNDTIVLPGMRTMLKELIKNSTNELDLFKKASIYCPQTDEPGTNKDKQLQNIICDNCLKRLKDELLEDQSLFAGKDSVKESFKKLPYLVTSYPRDYLKGATIKSITPEAGYEDICASCYCSSANDIKYNYLTCYCPTYESYQQGISSDVGYTYLMDKRNDPEFTLWWYSCIQPVSPYPCFFVNANLIQKRVNKFTEFALGVEGELYYMCNRTQEYHGGVSTPCTEEEILSGCATYEETYGDGSLIYPVKRTYGKYDPNLYWISSLRIDNVSESIDDYNYLSYFDELINKIEDSNLKNSYRTKLNALLSSVQNGPGKNTKDIDLFFGKRIELGNLIVEVINLQ